MPVFCSDLPAVVLDSSDHGESDKIITFFCQGTGRLTTIAKGAHRSKKRFVNKLELFSFLQITCSRSAPGNLAVLTEAELLNGFINIRSSISGYQAASIVREFIMLATSERLNDDNLFQLALWSFHALNRGDDRKTVLSLFLIKLFDYIGYRPDFTRCQQCGAAFETDGTALFRPLTGGLLCQHCQTREAVPGLRLSAGTVKLVISVQQQPLARLNRFRLSRVIVGETLDCLYRYGRHLFQREIHSWKWLLPL